MDARLLVPVDFSEFSDEAIEVALKYAGDSGEILLFHVYEPPRFARPDLIAWTELDGKMMPLAEVLKGEARHKLDALVEEASQRTKSVVTALVVEGRAVHAIVEAAEEHACDLIVLGTHGHSGFRRMVLGSVADTVVRTARCPVLAVPPRADHG